MYSSARRACRPCPVPTHDPKGIHTAASAVAKTNAMSNPTKPEACAPIPNSKPEIST